MLYLEHLLQGHDLGFHLEHIQRLGQETCRTLARYHLQPLSYFPLLRHVGSFSSLSSHVAFADPFFQGGFVRCSFLRLYFLLGTPTLRSLIEENIMGISVRQIVTFVSFVFIRVFVYRWVFDASLVWISVRLTKTYYLTVQT